ncbi:MAG: type II toxin-antitoxin system HicA family toxin [Rhodospirillales bacterium]|nr:type II toxin-antitoxin system HicA family toxin [Rhodospirillales bacterium]
MARLRVLSGRQVCRILAAHGFVEVRRRGSHIAMQRTDDDGTVTVTVPDHRELRTGTLLSIVRQSGVPRSAFEDKQ